MRKYFYVNEKDVLYVLRNNYKYNNVNETLTN